MKFTTTFYSAILATSAFAAPSVQPFAIVTRDDHTTSNVGGSVGCFGTDGNIIRAKITPRFEAIFFSEDNCKGRALTVAEYHVNFHYPIHTKSILLQSNYY